LSLQVDAQALELRCFLIHPIGPPFLPTNIFEPLPNQTQSLVHLSGQT